MSDLRAFAAAVLLAGGVAAAVSVATLRLADVRAPAVASVRLGELTARYARHAVDAATANDAPAEETAQAARAWARGLEEALAAVAARRGVVLLPARAVAAGAPDLTAEVEAEMAVRENGRLPANGAGNGR